MRAAAILVVLATAGCGVRAQPVSIAFRNIAGLGSSATDQNGQVFTVAGLSGISHRTGDEYWAVMDNSNKLVKLSVQVGSNGAISSAAIAGGLSLDTSRDFEGIALNGSAVYLSEETTPAVLRFDAATGSRLETYSTPPVFATMRPNRGLESLTWRVDAAGFWTANEEALTVDGPMSTSSTGTVVRLVRYGMKGGTFAPGPHYAYVTESWHGSSITEARSGVSDLLVLPDGKLLVLERSFAFSLAGFFRTRIYLVNFAGATDVSGLPGLIGHPYTPVTKTLLYEGDQQNLEGLALGPALSSGRYALIGIVDDGDPISVNRVVGFELSGVTVCYANCDGSIGAPVLTANDFQCFLDRFAAAESYANCDGSTGTPSLTANDFQCFINAFAAGCP